MCIWTPIGLPLSSAVGSIRFSGASNFLAIGAIHLGVKLPTSTALTSSLNPSVVGESVTFNGVSNLRSEALPSEACGSRPETSLLATFLRRRNSFDLRSRLFRQGHKITAIFRGTALLPVADAHAASELAVAGTMLAGE